MAADLVEATALAIISSFTKETNGKLLLVGFSVGLEFRILARQYPQFLTECLSAWTDVQEIVYDLSRTAFLPGMRDALTALGYRDDRVAVSRSRGNIHSAGNNTVRVFAVLLGLFALPLPTDPAAPS